MNVSTNKASLNRMICKGDGFAIALAEYEGSEIAKKFLNEKRYFLKATNTSYRIINHYTKIGLVNDNRKKQTKWRKLSVIDLIWIQIISQLRKFGLSLDKIKATKQSLFYSLAKPRTKTPQLELYISYCLLRQPCLLVVFKDGFCELALLEEYKQTIDLFSPLDSHIIINLNSIIQNIFSKKDLSPIYNISVELNNQELNLLLLIRNGNYQNIKIKFKDKKINLLELTKDKKIEKRIIDILKESKYQNIQITTANGKIIKLKQTIKKKA